MSPRVAIASTLLLGLLASAGWIGYRQGAAGVQQRWDRQTAAQAQIAAESLRLQARVYTQQLQQARQREQTLATRIEEIDRAHTQTLAAQRARAADADAAVQRLRDRIAAISRAAPASSAAAHPGAASSADGAAAFGELLGQCAARYRDLAVTADGLASQVTGLQDYARAVSGP